MIRKPWCPATQPSVHSQPWDQYATCIICGHHGKLTKNRRLHRHKGVPIR